MVTTLMARMAKWCLIAVLWVASVVAVTSSALVMDALADGLSRLAGISTPYADKKRKVAASDKQLNAEKRRTATERRKLKNQKASIQRHSLKVSKFSKKMVVRNVADATTSLVPVVGGAASVTFAALDVHAACELVAMQADLEASLGIASNPSQMESICIDGIEQIDAMVAKADALVSTVQDTDYELPDMPTLPDIGEVPGLSSAQETFSSWMCSASGNCAP